jgi:hypothetical protein
MGKYLLAYSGGSMPDSPEEQQAVMGRWTAWFGQLGPAVVDMGSPLGRAVTLKPGGAVSDGAALAMTGYTVLEASGLDEASTMAKGCPLLDNGGTVEVHEAVAMM